MARGKLTVILCRRDLTSRRSVRVVVVGAAAEVTAVAGVVVAVVSTGGAAASTLERRLASCPRAGSASKAKRARPPAAW